MDIRLARMARLLVEYSVNVQPGERVGIISSPAAADLVREVYACVLERGGNPLVYLSLPGLEEIFYRTANDAQLAFIDPVHKLMREEFEALINIRALENTRELSGVDPARQRLRSQALRPLMQRYMERGATGELKWNGTLFPTPASAQEADMSTRDYEDFVYGACFCDREDPVAEWRRVHDEQERVVQWFEGRDQVKVIGPNANLTLSVKDRVFVNSDGHHNMPSGEVFTGPVEDSANGWVRFTYPAIYGGREVEGVELTFEAGKVVKATAKKNEAYLLQMLDSDAGSRYLGEFAIGTNFGIQKFTKNILFDEKIGGSFHMALGAGYPDTGSHNQSAIHWDLICDMRDGGEIWADGELLYKGGAFVI
ncbi:MAG TPA: aminopeptidase [Anaerolineae bacterium]|nr:aminopeptidase [Anaerolineae bacterium]HQI83749.1 aminopeptidase [Anaerolineae bacterium]